MRQVLKIVALRRCESHRGKAARCHCIAAEWHMPCHTQGSLRAVLRPGRQACSLRGMQAMS